ncbi:MAG: hypothetical protein FJ261_16325 [Planctomycetes bacterium]|nr:hypothetical protein [Planctomycetota bacterium]
MHGYFVTPPAGEEATIPPLPDDKKQFAIAENHALLIEDDFSFYQRRGQAWKVVSIDVAKEKIKLEPIATGPAGAAKAPVPMKQGPLLPGGNEPGKLVKAGINTPFTFDIDGRSEIWQGRQLVELGAIRPGDNVQFNLAWCQGWGQGEFRVGRLWLDEESRTRATERQRQRHVQYERERWTAGWIDHIEHFDYGGGIVTATPAATAPPTCRSCWRGAAIGTVNISLETRGITPRWRSCTSTCCRGSACQRTSSAPALVPLRN